MAKLEGKTREQILASYNSKMAELVSKYIQLCFDNHGIKYTNLSPDEMTGISEDLKTQSKKLMVAIVTNPPTRTLKNGIYGDSIQKFILCEIVGYDTTDKEFMAAIKVNTKRPISDKANWEINDFSYLTKSNGDA